MAVGSGQTNGFPARIGPKTGVYSTRVMSNHLQWRDIPPVDAGCSRVNISGCEPAPRAPVGRALATAKELPQRDRNAKESHATDSHELAHGEELAGLAGRGGAPEIEDVDQRDGTDGDEMELRGRKDAGMRVSDGRTEGFAQHNALQCHGRGHHRGDIDPREQR